MNEDDQRRGDVIEGLKSSDLDIARITEDLIYLLVQKNVILFTELPEIVQEKLLSRETLRDKLSGVMLSPLSDDEGISLD